jgi:hypothetical protein
MTDTDSTQAGSGSTQARAYNLVLTEPSSSARVRALIQEFAHINRDTAEEWMANPPVAILENRPLQEVVDLRTRLMRLGVTVHIEESSGIIPVPGDQIDAVEESPVLSEPAEPATEAILEPQSEPPSEGDQPDIDNLLPTLSASAKAGRLSSSRIWTCLISAIVVGAALVLFTLWILNSMKPNSMTVDRSSSHQPSESVRQNSPASLKAQSDRTYQPSAIARDVNNAIRKHDGATAAKVLQDYDRLLQVENYAKALDRDRQLATRATPSPEDASRASKDSASVEADQSSRGGILDIDPSVISVLRDLKSRVTLSKTPEVNWEITGTRLTGWTDLPERTSVVVYVRTAGYSKQFRKQVAHSRITLPPFPEFPAGVLRIETTLESFGDQPRSIQRAIDLQTIPQLENMTVRTELDVPEKITPLGYNSLGWASHRIEKHLQNQGVAASASGLGVSTAPMDSLLLIKGQSQDVFAFVKSSILAAGLITMSIDDPPIWVLIEVNNERYWIESYLCRQAIRDYADNDPAVDNYLVNSLITM